ncbi:EPIDERMAL PATTERNING FACTOR-like protein 9 [Turnera subulata]|uniref:EPIDERMAL PATTERNING FACTOR-like protein 9 n=1 Tax=Turnera subulata TaxID=218843 RepID=A0A9Q0F507_9ROSI|nr:EPIDERMAL PATTERNING FACTOR-like protein 9 [Turnera subulata]
MANIKPVNLFLLLFIFTLAACVTQGSRTKVLPPYSQSIYPSQGQTHLQDSNEDHLSRDSRRLMIGSTAPTCTYNECRGCKYKCRAEQVPVEGNDPINSAYHYRCVCHR